MNIFIIYYLLHVSVFVTPSSGRQLNYLPKKYMLFAMCYIGCAIEYKVHPVFFKKITVFVTVFKTIYRSFSCILRI